jgi:REP element-mobilizing transposase RayT
MPRSLRIEYPGAIYHVMARGNHGCEVFRDHQDRHCWLETLGEACQKTGWRIHAYVLMGNHYHMLLETPEPNLSLGMQWLQSTYTSRYNHRHRLFGFIWKVCAFYRKCGYEMEAWKRHYCMRFSVYPRVTVLPERRSNKAASSWLSSLWTNSMFAPIAAAGT